MSLNDILITAIQIFAVLNPISIIPVFLSLSQDRTELEKVKIVASAILIAFIISLIVIFSGNLILSFVGITLDSFRMAGGILLLLSAIDMFSGIARGKRIQNDETLNEKESLMEIATVPLATPLLLGPGVITLIITFSYSINITDLTVSTTLALVIAGLILVLGIYIKRIISDSGIKLLSRLMALIVASIAIEFIHTSLVAWKIAV